MLTFPHGFRHRAGDDRLPLCIQRDFLLFTGNNQFATGTGQRSAAVIHRRHAQRERLRRHRVDIQLALNLERIAPEHLAAHRCAFAEITAFHLHFIPAGHVILTGRQRKRGLEGTEISERQLAAFQFLAIRVEQFHAHSLFLWNGSAAVHLQPAQHTTHMHLIARAVKRAVQHQQGGCLFRRQRRVVKLTPGAERSPHQHHIGPGTYPCFDTAMPILRQPGDTVADIKLPGLILRVQPGNGALRHRAAIRIMIHQDSVLTEAYIQICHLHHHVSLCIQHFLCPVHQAQRTAHLRVCLATQAQQVHTRPGDAAQCIIQAQHSLATLQHARRQRRQPTTGERSGILQHQTAAGG